MIIRTGESALGKKGIDKQFHDAELMLADNDIDDGMG